MHSGQFICLVLLQRHFDLLWIGPILYLWTGE